MLLEPCSVPECGLPANSPRGLCRRHYYRLRTYGSVMAEVRRSKPADWPWMLQQAQRDSQTNCLVWQRHTNEDGYGMLGNNGKVIRAHQLAYELNFGAIPAGMCVCHSCDNPPCIEPSHLWLGTQPENIADMVSKGRQVTPRGEANHQARLTESTVLAIRAADGTYEEIASRFKVCQATVGHIKTRRSWRHVA